MIGLRVKPFLCPAPSVAFQQNPDSLLGTFFNKRNFRSNSDIKPPLLVVDPDRFYRSGEKFFLKKKRRI